MAYSTTAIQGLAIANSNNIIYNMESKPEIFSQQQSCEALREEIINKLHAMITAVEKSINSNQRSINTLEQLLERVETKEIQTEFCSEINRIYVSSAAGITLISEALIADAKEDEEEKNRSF
jgi:hypothetical protein